MQKHTHVIHENRNTNTHIHTHTHTHTHTNESGLSYHEQAISLLILG